MKKKILAGFASALTLLALAGCNQTQPAESTPTEPTETPPAAEEPAPSADTTTN